MFRKLLSAVASLALFLAPMATLGAQESDYTKMSKQHQRVYDASLALYGTLGPVTHFLCTSTVVAERESARRSDGPNAKHEYLLLTAGHCVTGGDLPEGLTFSVADHIVPEADAADRTPVEVRKAEYDAKYDFAILYMASEKEYPVIETEVRQPDLEEKVYTVNYSMGIGKQVSLGEVASGPLPNSPDCNDCEGKYIVHMFAGPGASGAAVVSETSGKIVGVGEFGFEGEAIGLGCESTLSLQRWLMTPTPAPAPKVQSPQHREQKW